MSEKRIKGRTFTFGELWTGGGWPCETKNKRGKNCGKLSNVIQLSPEETEKLNKALPNALLDGRACGPLAANFILQNKMGKVVCVKHIEFID